MPLRDHDPDNLDPYICRYEMFCKIFTKQIQPRKNVLDHEKKHAAPTAQHDLGYADHTGTDPNLPTIISSLKYLFKHQEAGTIAYLFDVCHVFVSRLTSP